MLYIIILKKNLDFVFSLAINGIHAGQFATNSIKLKKIIITNDLVYYILELGSLTVTDLHFIPKYNSEHVLNVRPITPNLIYDTCSIVSYDEAKLLTVKGPGENKLIPLGCGSWCLNNMGRYYVYTFVLVYDLYLACFEKNTLPSLSKVATNCDKRNIGSNGGFGYRSHFDDMDISLMDSALLAHWACATTKPKKKQKISY